MSNTAVINLKTDPKLKKEAMELADTLGVSLSQVLNAALMRFTTEREFRVSEGYIPTPWLADVLAESKQHDGDVSFDTVEDAIKFLDTL